MKQIEQNLFFTNRDTIMKLTTGYKQFATSILAIALTSILGCASTTPSTAAKQGNREAAADANITSKVKAAILGEPSLKSAQIDVETSKGVVLLTGFVSSAAAENTATELARYIKGVTLVRDAIQIKY